MPEYPHAEKAILDPSKRIQTCAACGDPIPMGHGEVMRFGTTPDKKVLALHGDCASEAPAESPEPEGMDSTRYG